MLLPEIKPRILVVDDSRLVLRFATSVLKDIGLPLFTAENGREAWDFMNQNMVDLLITDIMMPEMDGFELIDRVRADSRFEQNYILVMTSLDNVEDKVRALGLGASDYTVKPLDAMEFRARVKAGLREIMLKKRLTTAMELLDNELILVGNLQKRLLPKKLPDNQRFSSAVCYQPCSRAGGDVAVASVSAPRCP